MEYLDLCEEWKDIEREIKKNPDDESLKRKLAVVKHKIKEIPIETKAQHLRNFYIKKYGGSKKNKPTEGWLPGE